MLIDDEINHCIKTLSSGGLILYPTDTIWGIGCDATNEIAVSKIYSLKNRAESKSMIILVADEKEILNYTDHSSPLIFDYIKGIHKPVTVVYPSAKNLPSNLINQDGSIGIRIVKDEFCKKIIRTFGKAIVSTSANISGYPPPGLFSDIDIAIKKGVDYIVKHRQDETTAAQPSSVVSINDSGNVEIIRA